MAPAEEGPHSPIDDKGARPRGILKHNASSDSAPPPESASRDTQDAMEVDTQQPSRPPLAHQLSEQEIVQQNTELNRGNRRSSSTNPRAAMPGSRRQSSAMDVDESNPRLKWDEANIFHTEQGRGQTMRIDEPKTPFIHNYNPNNEDDEGVSEYINPDEVNVDELDLAKRGKPTRKPSLIEPLDLGEAEDSLGKLDSSEKHVIVSNGTEGSITNHGEDQEEDMSAEALQKHREFEEKRKRHYEVPVGALSRPMEEGEEEDEAPVS